MMKPGTIFALPEGAFVLVADRAPWGKPRRAQRPDGEWFFDTAKDLVGPCVAALRGPTNTKVKDIKIERLGHGYDFFALDDGLPDGLTSSGEMEPPAMRSTGHYERTSWQEFLAAMRKANAPKPAKLSPYPKDALRVKVEDDDGVVVIASEKALASRYAARAFDGAYPKELVDGCASAALVAFATGEEGTATIDVASGTPDASYLRLGRLRIGKGDRLLVLPYSTFTMACNKSRGVLPKKLTKDLGARLDVAAGTYVVHARRSRNLAFQIYLAPGAGDDKAPPTDIVELPGRS